MKGLCLLRDALGVSMPYITSPLSVAQNANVHTGQHFLYQRGSTKVTRETRKREGPCNARLYSSNIRRGGTL